MSHVHGLCATRLCEGRACLGHSLMDGWNVMKDPFRAEFVMCTCMCMYASARSWRLSQHFGTDRIVRLLITVNNPPAQRRFDATGDVRGDICACCLLLCAHRA